MFNPEMGSREPEEEILQQEQPEQLNDSSKIAEIKVRKTERENQNEQRVEDLSSAGFSEREKGFLGKIKGNARKIANAFVLVSALSGCSSSENEPQAPLKPDNKPAATATIEQPRPQPIIERQKKVEEKEIEDDGNITESSKWSNEISHRVKEDMDKIKTSQDAEWLVRSSYNEFISEFYIPTKGDLKEGAYGIKTREYTDDDYKLLLKRAKEMKGTLESLNSKYGIEAYDKRQSQLDDMILKLEIRSSYAGKKQKEAVEKFEQFLQER